MVAEALLWALLVLGLLALLGLVVRKLPVLRVIDTSKVEGLSQRLVKLKLVELRLRRKLQVAAQFLGRKFGLSQELAQGGFQGVRGLFHQAAAKLERRLDRHTNQAKTPAELLAEAEGALKAGHSAEAERAYLEVIRHEPHSLPAYVGLGEVYLGSREYEQAKEVFEYLVGRGLPSAHLGLARSAAGQGQLELARSEYQLALAQGNALQPQLELARVLQALGDPAEAFQHLREAYVLEPRNPKLLDFYIELSIVNGQPIEAQAALDTMREVNPDNQKIPELALAVRQLADKLKVKRPRAGTRATTLGLSTRRKT